MRGLFFNSLCPSVLVLRLANWKYTARRRAWCELKTAPLHPIPSHVKPALAKRSMTSDELITAHPRKKASTTASLLTPRSAYAAADGEQFTIDSVVPGFR